MICPHCGKEAGLSDRVHVLIAYDHPGYAILGIFSTKAKAKHHRDLLQERRDEGMVIESHAVDGNRP